MKDFFSRYSDRIDVRGPEDCWPWTGATASAGYGHSHRDGKHFYAHRASYECTRGEIPAGLLIRHKCDNPPCVNPNHLEVGTTQDNVLDSVERGRANRARGEAVNTAKLTPPEVRELRAMVAEGEYVAVAARRFGICFNTAAAIVARRTWRHVA